MAFYHELSAHGPRLVPLKHERAQRGPCRIDRRRVPRRPRPTSKKVNEKKNFEQDIFESNSKGTGFFPNNRTIEEETKRMKFLRSQEYFSRDEMQKDATFDLVEKAAPVLFFIPRHFL